MNHKEFTKSLAKAIISWEKENRTGLPRDRTMDEWWGSFREFCLFSLCDFCVTCAGEGYVEEQTDVDCFKPYPCPDCAEIREDEGLETDILDEAACFGGVEDPFGEPRE